MSISPTLPTKVLKRGMNRHCQTKLTTFQAIIQHQKSEIFKTAIEFPTNFAEQKNQLLFPHMCGTNLRWGQPSFWKSMQLIMALFRCVQIWHKDAKLQNWCQWPITGQHDTGSAQCSTIVPDTDQTKVGQKSLMLYFTARSWAMPPFDRGHTTSYSTLIETMRLYCTVFKI